MKDGLPASGLWMRMGILVCLLVVSGAVFAAGPPEQMVIFFGQQASGTEKAVCLDLRHDLAQVTGSPVEIREEPARITGHACYFLVGTPRSSRLIAGFLKRGLLDPRRIPGPGGGRMQVVQDGAARVVVLMGPDVEGAQNTVYTYCSGELGVDPVAYWTGYRPKAVPGFDPLALQPRTVAPQAVPVICYMENDVDELANLHKPYLEYDMATWKGMVNSLRRMHYNAIQLFDMLGRPEFFTRAPYRALVPDYHANMRLVDSMIDYAHLKGMKIQVDLSLGYQMRSISEPASLCWSQYKSQWIATWIYYLTKTPLGKADIFSLRPRNQVWDRAYVSSCGEDKVQVFNDVFRVFDSVLHVYKPRAAKIAICYDDGMDMFNGGFNPPGDFTVAWSDDGYGDFNRLPLSTKGHPFGMYMHAGYWTNHTVQDPYPLKIDSVLSGIQSRFGPVRYLEVNGQTFRPFLLNLAAYSTWAYDPGRFDGARFYRDWCTRYFGKAAAPFAEASMKALHQAQFGRTGYVRNLGQIKSLIGFLQDSALVSSRGESYRVSFDRLHFPDLGQRMADLNLALREADSGLLKARDQAHFYYDEVYLPVLMYHQLLDFEITLMKAARQQQSFVLRGDPAAIRAARKLAGLAYEKLLAIDRTCSRGDLNPAWTGWYDPVHRRPNNGFPTPEMIRLIRDHLAGMKAEK